MTQEHSASEYHASLHLYGHLLSLSTRPLSIGNDIAVHDAVKEIESCMYCIRREGNCLVPASLLEIIKCTLDMAHSIPVRNLAQVVIGSLNKVLTSVNSDSNSWPVMINSGYVNAQGIERIVVSVGPTIGLGDELILAKALIEKVSHCNIPIHVETRRFALWNYHKYQVHFVGTPPSGLLAYLAKLDSESLYKTGYIYLDFLTSDPTPVPRFMLDSLAFSGRWVFGNATVQITDPRIKTIHTFEYPREMPLSRTMQCDWVAGRILSEAKQSAIDDISTAEVKTPHSGKKCILLQVLTSKPELILPPEFYQTCFSEINMSLRDEFYVKVIAGPTDSARKINQSICDALTEVIQGERVELCRTESLDRVVTMVAEADLLVGPDTFTAHLAAHFNIPQITFFLPHHHAWVNSASRSFFLPYRGNTSADLPRAIARRIAFTLELNKKQPDITLLQFAREWIQTFEQLHNCICMYLFDNQYNPIKIIEEQICRIEPIVELANQIIGQTLKNDNLGINCPPKLDRACFQEDLVEKNMRKIAHWYHNAGSSDLSGILHNFKLFL